MEIAQKVFIHHLFLSEKKILEISLKHEIIVPEKERCYSTILGFHVMSYISVGVSSKSRYSPRSELNG